MMKKIIKIVSATLLCGVLLLSMFVVAFADGTASSHTYVDESASLSPSGINEMNVYYKATTEKIGCLVGCIVTNDFHGLGKSEYVARCYADYLADETGDGIVILVMPDSGEFDVFAYGYKGLSVFHKTKLDEIKKKMMADDCFADKNYVGMAKSFCSEIEESIKGRDPFSASKKNNSFSLTDILKIVVVAWIPLATGILLAKYFRSFIKKKYRNLEKPSISVFENAKETVYYEKIDIFLREYTTDSRNS